MCTMQWYGNLSSIIKPKRIIMNNVARKAYILKTTKEVLFGYTVSNNSTAMINDAGLYKK